MSENRTRIEVTDKIYLDIEGNQFVLGRIADKKGGGKNYYPDTYHVNFQSMAECFIRQYAANKGCEGKLGDAIETLIEGVKKIENALKEAGSVVLTRTVYKNPPSENGSLSPIAGRNTKKPR